MVESPQLDKICFVLEKYKSKYSLNSEEWNFNLRWIDMPYASVLKALKSRDWAFTLRPALDSGLLTAQQVKVLDTCHSDRDLAPALVNLALDGVNPMLVFESTIDYTGWCTSQLEKVFVLRTGKVLFDQKASRISAEVKSTWKGKQKEWTKKEKKRRRRKERADEAVCH